MPHPTPLPHPTSLTRYVDIEIEIQKISPVHNIGALSLETAPLKVYGTAILILTMASYFVLEIW